MESQAKIERNDSKWKIQIDGDKRYIEDLVWVIEKLKIKPSIYKEGENFYLESKIFDNIEDTKVLSGKAKTLLALMPMLPHSKSDRYIEPLKILKIIEISEGGKEEKIYDSNGIFIRSKRTSKDGKATSYSYVSSGVIKTALKTSYLLASNNGTITGGLTTIESVKDYLLKIKNDNNSLNKTARYLKPFFDNLVKYSNDFAEDKMTKEISTILSNSTAGVKIETLKWVNLYKIYELIEKSIGGERELKARNWVNEGQIDSFKCTSNYYNRHSVFKVFRPKPKERKMKLFEAQEIVSTLLSKHIEEKTKNQGDKQ